MSKKFYNHNPEDLRFVTFDIETTGFKAGEDDIVTNIIAHDNETYYIWLNANGDSDIDYDKLKQDIINQSSTLNDIVLYVSQSEPEMFKSISDYISDLPKSKTVFTAFNGETYRGNTDFDLPFLRTRFFNYGLPWPFKGFWYTDSYEVFSQKNRFNTTVTEEPTLSSLNKSEQQKFVDDMNINIHYSNMNKSEIIIRLDNDKSVTETIIKSWAKKHNIINDSASSVDINAFTKSQLQKFIDDMDINISYKKLSAKELESEIKSNGYTPEMLREWYKKTNRSVGTMNMTTLDGIHEKIIENKINDNSWVENSTINMEIFESFDPYDDSEEAVTGYENKEYVDLILHCLSDVARTVNLTKIMIHYISPQDYRPKTL